jgi:hypothetical protein
MIQTLYQLECVDKIIGAMEQRAHIFLDVDDTLITPKAKAFRAPPTCHMIDNIKACKDTLPNYKTILSNWRLQRAPMLVEEAWPKMIKKWREKGHWVFALTHMDTGAFGAIPSMEQWRFNELKALGICFSDASCLYGDDTKQKKAFEGIFITGPLSKTDILSALNLSTLQQKPLIFLDDRLEQIQRMDDFCVHNAIQSHCIHYRGVDNCPGQPDAALASFQEQWLRQKAIWLEDDEALIMMGEIQRKT